MLSSATITFDIADMLGVDYDTRRGIRAWVDTNIPGDTVVDTDGNKIRLGSGKVTVNADGTGTASVWIPGTGSNPASWQTYFHFEYVDSGDHKKGRQTRTFGPFTITASANLADLVAEQEVPPEYAGQLVAEMAALRDETEAHRTAVENVVITDLGTTDGQTKTLIETPSSLTAKALGRNYNTWTPPGTNAATNATSLGAAISAAIAADRDLLINAVGTVDIAGPVTVGGSLKVFGQGRGVTVLHQTIKPEPLFHVTGTDVTMEDFTILGDGVNFTVGVAEFQDYNGVRIERDAHGFTARRLGFKDIYLGLMIRDFPESPTATHAVAPNRLERLVVEDIFGEDVWAVLHGGPLDSPRIDNIRGNIVNATGHADTAGHAPHLIYIASPTPTSGIYTDGFYTRGGTFTNLSAWDGPDFIGAAYSFKHCRGIIADGLTARGYRGVIELLGVEDSTFGIVSSMEDKYPATGSDAQRASVSFASCKRVRIKHLSVDFAAVDHGKALRFEATSSDCEVERLVVVERGTLDRRTGNPNGDISFVAYLQGVNNTIRNADITNLGQPKYAAITLSPTGSRGKVINPRIGAGYEAHIRVDATHLDAVLDYDPIYLVPDRTITSVRTVVSAGNRCAVRDRSIGQTLPAGFVDEFDRGVTVSGFALTDDNKTWTYYTSGGAGPASAWQATAAGTAGYVGAGARNLALVDGVSANGTIKTTVGTLIGFGSGIAFRATDFNNYLGLMFSTAATNGQLDLHKRVAGTRTMVAQSTVGAITADSVVEIVMAGTSVSVKVGGVQVIAPQTISDFSTVTLHGLLGTSDGVGNTLVKRLEFTPA